METHNCFNSLMRFWTFATQNRRSEQDFHLNNKCSLLSWFFFLLVAINCTRNILLLSTFPSRKKPRESYVICLPKAFLYLIVLHHHVKFRKLQLKTSLRLLQSIDCHSIDVSRQMRIANICLPSLHYRRFYRECSNVFILRKKRRVMRPVQEIVVCCGSAVVVVFFFVYIMFAAITFFLRLSKNG